jgi:hypothetical protein
MVPEFSPKETSIASTYSEFGLAIGASPGHQVAEKLNGNNHLLPSLKKKRNNHLLWKPQVRTFGAEESPAHGFLDGTTTEFP